MKIKDLVDDDSKKLIDGGHVILTCSNCGKKLVDLLIVRPNELKSDGAPFVWNCTAKCCYCADKSFVTEVKGIFRAAGIIDVNPDNDQNWKEITALTDIVTDGDNVLFETAEVK